MEKIMEAREINSKLLELLPKAKELFDSVTNWQDKLDTGSTIVMEDVFMVYLKECIEKDDDEELSNCSAFIEWLSDYSNDEYAGDVLVISVFEYIHFAEDSIKLEKALGPKAKAKYDSIDWN